MARANTRRPHRPKQRRRVGPKRVAAPTSIGKPLLINRFSCPCRVAAIDVDSTHPGYQESVDQHRRAKRHLPTLHRACLCQLTGNAGPLHWVRITKENVGLEWRIEGRDLRFWPILERNPAIGVHVTVNALDHSTLLHQDYVLDHEMMLPWLVHVADTAHPSYHGSVDPHRGSGPGSFRVSRWYIKSCELRLASLGPRPVASRSAQ